MYKEPDYLRAFPNHYTPPFLDLVPPNCMLPGRTVPSPTSCNMVMGCTQARGHIWSALGPHSFTHFCKLGDGKLHQHVILPEIPRSRIALNSWILCRHVTPSNKAFTGVLSASEMAQF